MGGFERENRPLPASELSILGRKLSAFKLNADGSPAHPLYLSRELKPIPFGGD